MNRLEKKIVLLLLLVVTTVSAQIGVGTKTPHPDAMVEVKSTNKGFLLPRVALTSTTSVAPLSAHIEGMSVYNTATTADVTPGYYYNDGAKWIRLVSGIVADASATATGKIQLAGDLSGTATVPTVPGLALKANLDSPKFTGNVGVGTTATTASAALEVESTTAGVLISRMTSAQRDAITSPSNSLLIFNITNNNFEVFKTTCNCWVSVLDGGNTPATDKVNTAPTVNNINYTGTFYAGQAVTVNYTYTDAQNDPESGTSFQWQQATSSAGADPTIIDGANTATYTIPSNIGSTIWIRALVTPRSSAGVKNGVISTAGYVKVDPASLPSALNVAISGTPTQGNMLTGSYDFTGGNGTESSNPTQPTLFNWQYASDSNGLDIRNASMYDASSFTTTYVPQSDLLGKYVRFGVRARDSNGTQATNFVYSPWVGPIEIATEQSPSITNITITPNPAEGISLNGSYSFFDANGDPEATSTYQWYRADDASGLNEVIIDGATNKTYIPVEADAGKYLAFAIVPHALSGSTPGIEYKGYNSNQVLPAAIFTFTSSNIQQLPFFSQGRLMNSSDNSITVEVNVTGTGGATFTSDTVNGYSFSNIVTFTTTGVQPVTLNPSGTLNSFNASGDQFSISGIGRNNVSKSISIKNTLTGAAATAHSNGSEMFSANSDCASALISAGYNSSTCNGSITVGSNTYNLVLIGDQCWMQSNLREAPTAPCADAPNTGCNVYGAIPAPVTADKWGYYNTIDNNGWATTPPGPGEGMLYQWNAAMNGSTKERARGACPEGFHVPSDCEFKYLEHGLGMTITDQNLNANRLSGSVGSKLNDNSTGMLLATNTSGFTMLRGGRRHNGAFGSRGSNEQLWTSTAVPSSTDKWRRNNSTHSVNGSGFQRAGDATHMSSNVRCIKD